MVSGSHKGSRAERKVARKLTVWLRNGGDKNPPELWRSKMSGGWEYREIPDIGDLQPNGKLGAEFRQHFSVEIKHYEEIDWWEVFTHEDPDVIEWWDKHWAECKPYELCPLLIIRANYRPWLVGHPADLYDEHKGTSRLMLPSRNARFVEYDRWTEFTPEDTYNWYERWREERFGGGD